MTSPSQTAASRGVPTMAQPPLALSSNELANLVNENPNLPQLSAVKNPMQKGWSPRLVTPATNHHVNSQASMFSMANIKQYDYSGFLTLAILVFFVLVMRLILENLLKYGFIVKFTNPIPTQPSIILPFVGVAAYIVIVAPVLSWGIEVLATRKTLFQSAYTPTPSALLEKNNSVHDIQSRALIGPKAALWLHVANNIGLFLLPLIYIWNTTTLPLVLRFPIAFMCVVTTMKLFSYAHTSTSIRTTTGQCIAFDTCLENNRIDSLSSRPVNNTTLTTTTAGIKLTTDAIANNGSKSSTTENPKNKHSAALNQYQLRAQQQEEHFAQLAQTTTNTTPVPLSQINPNTAIVLPHQGKQSIVQMQYDIYSAMCLSYFHQLKLLLHTITMRYISFTPDELWTHIDDNTSQASKRQGQSFITKIVNLVLFPVYFTSSLLFGYDKRNRIYRIITRGFGQQHTDHTFSYQLSYLGEESNQFPGADAKNSPPFSPNDSSSNNDFSLFGASDDLMFAELFDQDTKNGSGLEGANKRMKSTKVTIHVENHFNQTQTNILHLSKPSFSMGQKVDEELDNGKAQTVEVPEPNKSTSTTTTAATSQQQGGKKKAKTSSSPKPTAVAAPSAPTTHPVTVTYSKTSYLPTHSIVNISNLEPYPTTLPRYAVFDYAPCLSQLLYFLIAPTLIYQISYPRSSRIKLHFILRRAIELLSIGLLLLFFVEQFVRPTLINSIHYFLSLDHANSQLKEKLHYELQQQMAGIPNLMNNTFSMIESSVNSTLSKIISEDITNKLLESTNTIANSIVDQATSITSSQVQLPSTDDLPAFWVTVGTVLSSTLGIVERTLKLSIPNVIIWLLIFYGLFHSYLNLVAEIAQFGDRCFYEAWWNSEHLGSYWNLWNKPVYQFFGRHIFSVLVGAKLNTNVAKVAVFLVSAILHEVLIAVPMQIVAFHAFFGMLFQAPLVFITVYLYKKHNNPVIGNIIFWVSFVILGQPSLILMYFYQYLTTHGLIPSAMANTAVAQIAGNSP